MIVVMLAFLSCAIDLTTGERSSKLRVVLSRRRTGKYSSESASPRRLSLGQSIRIAPSWNDFGYVFTAQSDSNLTVFLISVKNLFTLLIAGTTFDTIVEGIGIPGVE